MVFTNDIDRPWSGLAVRLKSGDEVALSIRQPGFGICQAICYLPFLVFLLLFCSISINAV